MTTKSKPTVHIIGAGISGLIAAKTLESLGYSPIIYEASDRTGGRVKTDIEEGFLIDHGFQVLLDAYPMAKKHLDLDALNLQKFLPGAIIYDNGKSYTIGDPLRSTSFLIPTLFAPIGTIGDKLKIMKLNKVLKQKSIEEIFDAPEKTTYQYLVNFGFSKKIIENFFRPFFAGIFLEEDLETSSRMFEFIYKMFGEGYATLPKDGIKAIPEQLEGKLQNTTINKGVRVEEIKNKETILESGETVKSDFTIVATNVDSIIPQMVSSIEWKGCDNLYFRTPEMGIKKSLIGLNTNKDSFVNNIFFTSSLEVNTRIDEELLSVTVVKKHNLSLKELIQKVKEELVLVFGITDAHFLAHFPIPRSLPSIRNLKYSQQPSEFLVMDHVAIAGDHTLNGSLNAAMISGESAAMAAHEVLSGIKFS